MNGYASGPDPDTRKYFGKYPGLVLDPGPGEDQVHRGRILVEVPGILEEDPDDETRQRAIQVIAKPCLPSGFFHMPQKEDPVWVEFAAGSVDEPLWSGVWHPEEGAPENSEDAAPTEHDAVLRTASGHVLEMSDEKGNGRIVLRDGVSGGSITMDGDGILIEDGNGNTITLDSGGITLEAGSSSIELTASGITVSSGAHRLEIDSAGGTTLTDALGASSAAIVLAPVLSWLASHQHLGNMGAPTPVFPSDLATIMVHDQVGTGKSAL
ncbi:MAG: hypothetical protein EA350_03805 [Gemmatimonadales bacterium]|nr:MAG: hypothetical protein EA350_03805 [Gemmatimonadales bacterium]